MYGYLKVRNNAEYRVSGHQRGAQSRAYIAHGRVSQCRKFTHGCATGAHNLASLTIQNFRFFRFCRFTHKIPILNPISIPFSPTRSNHLNLSHSREKSCFPTPNKFNPISPKITYFTKTVQTTFTRKFKFLPNNPTPKTFTSKQKI